jgi:putative transposase
LRFAFIEAHRWQFRIVAMCRVLEVSKAGYYAWRERKPSARAKADTLLSIQIRAIHRKSRGRYGSPMIQAELRDAGFLVARKRVARLMRIEQIQGKKRRAFRVTTKSAHSYPVAPNRLDRQFTAAAPNRAWVADVTYLLTREGWLYLAVVLDLFSRRVVGWSMSNHNDAPFVLSALKMAVDWRKPKAGLIVHTDRGSQYACNQYRAFTERHGVIASMSRKRDCWDNAVAESFFATLKLELQPDRLWKTRSEARTAIFEYIEGWYNRERRHSTIGYLSPATFESQHVA